MSLSPAQLPILKAAILAETDPIFVAMRVAGQLGAMAAWYSDFHPTFIVYKNSATVAQVWRTFLLSEVANLTTANTNRLQVMRDLGTFDPFKLDHRDGVENVFGVSGTKTALAAFWKRAAKRVEALFATGTGTDALPATLVYEGNLSLADLVLAQAS